MEPDYATIGNLLEEDELESFLFKFSQLPTTTPLNSLTTKQLSGLFLVVKLRIARYGKLPACNIVSAVWEELTERAIENELHIF